MRAGSLGNGFVPQDCRPNLIIVNPDPVNLYGGFGPELRLLLRQVSVLFLRKHLSAHGEADEEVRLLTEGFLTLRARNVVPARICPVIDEVSVHFMDLLHVHVPVHNRWKKN